MPIRSNNAALIKERLNNRFQPRCVCYWDRQFLPYLFWKQWLNLKHTIQNHTADIQAQLECNYRDALDVAWSTYIDVTGGEQDNPFIDEYVQLIRSIEPHELPLYLCHTSIGTDIQNGYSEQEALSIYINWLNDDVDNPIFGDWALTNNLTVMSTTQFLRSRTR